MAATYFIMSSITTVGYGDFTVANKYEQVFCMLIMLFGVLLFTFVSGALSSIISNYDNQQAALQEKLLYLNRLRLQYHLPDKLYADIKKSLIFDFKTNLKGLDQFVS